MERNAEKSPLPVVAVDGARIKTVREEKKLTQLYVASVVGVTTDTISRWENNRYPTIRRDNAEKLAAALEVDLDQILRGEEPAGPEPEAPAAGKNNRGRMLLLVLAVAGVIIAGLWYWRHQPVVPMVARKLPRFAAPGAMIPVQLRIDRKDASAGGVIIKERLPAGWRLVSALPPATSSRGSAEEVKWLIPPGKDAIIISYVVQVPPYAELKTTALFEGEIVARDDETTRKGVAGGDRALTVAGVHWADLNGDNRIDDDEIMPAYYLTEEMKGLPLDWKTIENLWSGTGYRWDRRTGSFQVLR